MKYRIEDYECNVVIEKKNNKNTYIRVKENNTILVTTHYLVTKKQIMELLDNNEAFILRSLKRLEKKEERNDKFLLLGKEYNVIVLANSKIDIQMETNVKGVYACGNITGGLLQICKAVYEGAQAGLSAVNYIRKDNV